jgi:primosomal protein N' (replication factor Y)
MPEHPVLEALISGDRNAFLEAERLSREAFEMPPYGRLVALVVSGLQEEFVEKAARHLGRYFRVFSELEVLGPTAAPLAKIRNRYRWRLLLRTSKDHRLQPFLRQMQKEITLPSTLRLQIDIDPYSFL